MPEPEDLKDALFPELLKIFPAAFLGRLTIVPYYPLGADSLSKIVCLQLDKVKKRMAMNHQVELSYSDEVVKSIVDRCLVSDTGARVVISYIEKNVLADLGFLWLNNMSLNKVNDKVIKRIEIIEDGGNISFVVT